MKRISASAYNSAAFNDKDYLWIWGGTSRGKLGMAMIRDQLEPLNLDYEVSNKPVKEGISSVEIDNWVHLEPFLDENKKHHKYQTEYISEFQAISWGVDHCVFVDKQHRVFSTGKGQHGRLGHGGEKDKIKPHMIRELEGKEIIDVQCGHYHSLAISKTGDIYSWGYGHMGRLG